MMNHGCELQRKEWKKKSFQVYFKKPLKTASTRKTLPLSYETTDAGQLPVLLGVSPLH